MSKQQLSKKEKIERLTLKYFYIQKFQEVLIFLGSVFFLTVFPYGLGRTVPYCRLTLSGGKTVCGVFDYWSYGVLILCLLFFFLIVLYVVIRAIQLWIKSNYKKARKRAMKEIK
jgi:hypothetical protein